MYVDSPLQPIRTKKDNFMSKFYNDLKKGLKEAAEYKRGKLNLIVETIEIPEPPADYSAQKIKQIREQKNIRKV